MLNCKYCNKEFERTGIAQKYCSITCRVSHKYHTYVKPKKKKNRITHEKANCLNCGQFFNKRNSKHIFCSSFCNLKYTNMVEHTPDEIEEKKLKPVHDNKARIKRLKEVLLKNTVIRFKLPNYDGHHLQQYSNKVLQGVISQVTDNIIAVKIGDITHSINWIDIYTRKIKIQLVRQNVA